MKQKFNFIVKVILATVLTQNSFAQVATDKTYLKPPPAPVYETCKEILVDNGEGGTYPQPDHACNARNAQKQRDYGEALNAYNRAKLIMTEDASVVTKPAEPIYRNCKTTKTSDGSYITDYACEAENQAKTHDYNIQMDGYNRMLQQEAVANQQAAQTEAEKQAAALSAASATEALRQAALKNAQQANQSSKDSSQNMMSSVAMAGAFAATCAAASCQFGLLAASIAFSLISGKHAKQAGENNASFASACATQAQLSGNGTDCGVTPPDLTAASKQTLQNTFDSEGNCTAVDKTICSNVLATLPKGVNIKDVMKGASSFATTGLPFKTNPNGTITTKDGKIYKPSDFSSRAAMIAAGFSPDQADSAMGMISKIPSASSTLANASSDLKNSSSGKFDLGSAAISGSGSGGTEVIKIGGGATSGALGSKAIQDGLKGRRTPAGEGLIRDFNGEKIGAAGDDIFSMMNRRYKTKTAQDAFISN